MRQWLYFAPMSNNSLAFVFPGQGSQSVGMLSKLAEQSAVVRATFDEASTVLGYDLWQLCQQGPVRGPEFHRTHSAGDADCRHCDLAPVAGTQGRHARPSSPATVSVSSPLWSPRARSTLPPASTWCDSAARSCRKPCPPGTRRHGGVVRTRGCRGGGRLCRSRGERRRCGSSEFQFAGTGRHRRRTRAAV